MTNTAPQITYTVCKRCGERKDSICYPNNIRPLRKERGLTQGQTADLVGISKNYLNTVECGRKPIQTVSYRILEKLAHALGATINDLFTQEAA